MTIKKNISFSIALFVAVIVVFTVAQIASAAPLADGLVGYWDLNSNADEQVNNLDGTIIGGTTFPLSGVAIGSTHNAAFDGDGDAIEVGDDAELDLSTGLTVAGWINVNTAAPAQSTVASKWNDLAVNQRGYLLAIHTDDTPQFYVSNDGINYPSAMGAPLTGGWHYLVGTYDGVDVKLYVDGVLAATTPAPGTIFQNNESLLIGATDGYGGVRKFTTGGVDEVRIYNRALSATEAAALSGYGFDVVLTPDGAVNPIGTDHTVTATLNPALSYIPVLFERSGVNGYDNTFGPIPHYVPYVTDGNGQIAYTFSGAVTGVDTIVGCVDTSWYVTGGGICNAPFPEPSDSVVKTWTVGNFVTGGGIIKSGKKVIMNFGGTVGRTDAGVIVGNYHIVDHVAKKSCHFKDITSLVFSGSTTTSPVSSLNIATFTANGTCNNGDTPSITVVIKDVAEPGKGSDTVNITGSLTTGGTKVISGGNIQVHPPK